MLSVSLINPRASIPDEPRNLAISKNGMLVAIRIAVLVGTQQLYLRVRKATINLYIGFGSSF